MNEKRIQITMPNGVVYKGEVDEGVGRKGGGVQLTMIVHSKHKKGKVTNYLPNNQCFLPRININWDEAQMTMSLTK